MPRLRKRNSGAAEKEEQWLEQVDEENIAECSPPDGSIRVEHSLSEPSSSSRAAAPQEQEAGSNTTHVESPAVSTGARSAVVGSRFHAALRAGTAYELGKNRVQFIPFHQGDALRGIGLDSPEGGAVIAICSPVGVIMGHIPACPIPMIDGPISMDNLRRRMNEVVETVREYSLSFPLYSFSLMVIPTIDGRMALAQHAIRIRHILAMECLEPAITTYAMPIEAHQGVERGVVYVEGSIERFAVYVEGRCIVQLGNVR